jgi:hypothetical protein
VLFSTFIQESIMSEMLGNVQGQMGSQLTKIMSIPSTVMANWPAFFSFALVDYVSRTVFALVPEGGGGSTGMVMRAAKSGARDVVKMATWDAVKL